MLPYSPALFLCPKKMPLFTYKCTACQLTTERMEIIGSSQITITCQCGATANREYKPALSVMGQGAALVDSYDRDADAGVLDGS